MPRPEGQAPRLNLRCTSCGYGVFVRTAPDRCPMCGGAIWEHADPDVLGRVLQARVRREPADVRTLFRRLNEELASTASGDELELVCECADRRCFASVALDRDDFRALMATPYHYVVLPGHEAGDEVAVAEGTRFVVVAARPASVEVQVHGLDGRGRARQ